MISKLAWNAFKKTGNIDTFLEFIKTQDVEMSILEGKNGDCKDESNYFKRK